MSRRKLAVQRRAWRRLDAEYTPALRIGVEVLVRIANGPMVITLQGPEDSVEPLVDRLLRELPE